MADIYFYIDKTALNETMRYGMKLSKTFHAEVIIDGILKKCMFGVLNPKDDFQKWNLGTCSCIRAELKNDYLFVTDTIFINTNYFEKSLIPIHEYKFGTYKSPIVIVFCSILPEQLHTISRLMDVPVLFESSKDLYYKTSIEKLKEGITNSDEVIFSALVTEEIRNSSLEKISLSNGVEVYKNEKGEFFY